MKAKRRSARSRGLALFAVLAVTLGMTRAAAQGTTAREDLRGLGLLTEPTLLPGRTSPPILGTIWDPVVSLAAFPGADRAFLLVSQDPASDPIAGVGQLFCRPPVEFLGRGTPGVPFQVPLPPRSDLAGRTFCVQGLAAAPDESFRLTANAIDVTLGTAGDLASFYLVSVSLGCTNAGFGGSYTCTQTTIGLTDELVLRFSAPVDLASVDRTTLRIEQVATYAVPPWTASLDPADPTTLIVETNISPGFYNLQVPGVNRAALRSIQSVFGVENEDQLDVPFLAF